ncbi:hypothetical protein QC762_0078930 [Podospora pseudocomata]|uniref:Uncharacterized protein n=1 Tax=Podospora pseudocomata TaxID=2093779 RepID=A0ABR0GB62_9PEZI|nr:hypothetical protein QC762_0078930 [Podospora pseudocomata]
MNYLHLIEWKDREAPWRDEITTEVRKFPLLATELSECKHHTCCIVKPTILFCDDYSGGISQRAEVATPARGIDYKGFVEHEFHYLGDLATVGRSKQHRKAGRRWFDIYQEEDHTEIFNFEDSPMLPLEPFPLELVYRHDLEGVDLTAWEEEHNNTLPDLKPIYIDVNHHPLASE